MGPGELQGVLADLKGCGHPDLLVGLGERDDAAVYRITDDAAVVVTVDFFPPIVDDPYTYGAIAAANSMSDVYAMGGQVLLALNVAGFPRDFPREVIAEIFRGGAEKVAEAGGVVAGGHTVVDAEPKYGLCVTGRVHPEKIFVKGGFKAGDRLYLSKPLGTGVITTAAKANACDAATLDGAVKSMTRLNRGASEVARELEVRGATDITGFGFMGHAAEMVEAAGAGITIRAGQMPLLDGALSLARQGQWSGGMKRNRRHVESTLGARGQLIIDASLPTEMVGLLFESETSGGLLFSVSPERAETALERFRARGEPCWKIGEVTSEPGIRVL